LFAQIGYGPDENFANNKAKRNLSIQQTGKASTVLAAIENNLDFPAELTVTAYEVKPEENFIRDKNPLELRAYATTFMMSNTDPPRAIALGLPALPATKGQEVTRHIDFEVTAKLTDGKVINQGGFRFVQRSEGGRPPKITTTRTGIVVSDEESGIAYISITNEVGGKIFVPPFVPGVKQVALEIKERSKLGVSFDLEVWDCCLNRTKQRVTLGK
jgi:hypothetical protein